MQKHFVMYTCTDLVALGAVCVSCALRCGAVVCCVSWRVVVLLLCGRWLLLTVSWSLLPFVRASSDFSTRRHSEHWADITLGQQHLRPSQKHKHIDREGSLSTCDQHFITNCQRTQTVLDGKCVSVGVCALAVASLKKRDVTSMTGSKNDICNRKNIP